MVERSLAIIVGVALAASLASPSRAAEDQVPLSRVLLSVTDLKASIAKISLARYYLQRASEAPEADGERRESVLRARRSLRAAHFYVASSTDFARGELLRDLESVEEELKRLESSLGREPAGAPEDLEALGRLEERLREMLGSIDRAARTYKGSSGWTPSWEAADGKPAPPGAEPSP